MSFEDNKDGTYRYSYMGSENTNTYDPYSSPYSKKPKKERKNLKFFAKVIVAAIVFGLISGSVSYGVFRLGNATFGVPGQPSQIKEGKVSSGGTVNGTAVSTATTVNDVTDIAENVMPAIVQVTNMSVVEYRGFFGQIYKQNSESAGSGVIFADDGDSIYIATNNHVVSNSKEITITFCNNEAVSAILKGVYPQRDLAVVRVSKTELTDEALEEIKVATLADSDSVAVGQATVVIGNALGYGQSVTTGVVSALDREVSIQDDSTGEVVTNELIQTDATINPGNSGGALLNMNGEVIGIVSAKYSGTAVEGMGYAIPISTAKEIIDEIIAKGYYEEKGESSEASSPQGNGAYLGIVGGMDIDQNTAMKYNMPTGVYVSQVLSGSAAEKAGIERGDVIRAVDGKQVSSIKSLQEILADYNPGDSAKVTVANSRDNYRDVILTVILDNRND